MSKRNSFDLTASFLTLFPQLNLVKKDISPTTSSPLVSLVPSEVAIKMGNKVLSTPSRVAQLLLTTLSSTPIAKGHLSSSTRKAFDAPVSSRSPSLSFLRLSVPSSPSISVLLSINSFSRLFALFDPFRLYWGAVESERLRFEIWTENSRGFFPSSFHSPSIAALISLTLFRLYCLFNCSAFLSTTLCVFPYSRIQLFYFQTCCCIGETTGPSLKLKVLRFWWILWLTLSINTRDRS